MHSFFEKCRWFNIQLTTAFGITTTIHWSVLAFVLMFLFLEPLQAGILCIALLSVVPHEYGHALAARMYGIKTARILIYPLGGVALMIPDKENRLEGWKEIVVAIAGPLVSLALAVIGFAMLMLNPPASPVKIHELSFWFWLFLVNSILFVFNLIPAFPMDGGRILRGFINLFADHLTSTRYAYYCSLFFCMFIGVWGLLNGNLFLPLTMFIIHFLAKMEYEGIKMENSKENLKQSTLDKSNGTPII